MTKQKLKSNHRIGILLDNLKRHGAKQYSICWLSETVKTIEEIETVDQLFKELRSSFGILSILDVREERKHGLKIYTLVRK